MQLNGIYQIKSASPEKNKRREGRYVIFPDEVKKGERALWFYVHAGYDHIGEDFIGKHVKTSLVQDIEYVGHTVVIYTMNSEYIFVKVE